MSRRATWWTILVLLAAFWSAVGLGAKAAAAPVSDAPVFLERYGIDAREVPLVVTDDAADYGFQYAGLGPAVATTGYDAIRLSPGIEGQWLAEVVLHEYLHEASFWQWTGDQWARDDMAWLLAYEEGLVQATAEALMPNWWRHLTGKRLSREWTAAAGYDDQARWWKALAQRATGSSWRSRAGREWLLAAVRMGPSERTALVV